MPPRLDPTCSSPSSFPVRPSQRGHVRPIVRHASDTTPPLQGDAMPIFVINLPRDAGRLATMDARLRSVGLAFTRVPGFEGPRHFERVRRLTRREFFSPRLNRAMTPGEIGCTLSHLRALRAIVAQRLPRAVVLEDDVDFEDGFAPFFREELPRLLDVADVVKLEGIRDSRSSRSGITVAETRAGPLFIPLRPALGSAGYAVNARGARLLLRAFRRVDRPLDHLLAAYDVHGAIYAELARFPVFQDDSGSNIKHERQSLKAVRPSFSAQACTLARVANTGAWRLVRIGSVLMHQAFTRR